jgi:hypothetical protein
MGMSVAENKAIGKLEARHLKKSRKNIYIACEELNFVWDERSVPKIDEMWKEGHSIIWIGDAFDVDVDELTLLIFDRARKGYIDSRPGGIFGSRKVNLVDGKETG